MREFVLFSDSCVDLPNELATELGLTVIPLTVNVEGKEYKNYLDEREIKNVEFYNMLREYKKTSTSQINANTFMEALEPLVAGGKDVLVISFSSALSGTYNGAVNAAEELNEKYTKNKIVVIDSKCASMGQGLLVYYAAMMKKAGKSMDDVAKWVEENKLKVSHLFTVGDLNHLKRGGRLSSSKAFIGTILRVKPLLNVSTEGKLVQQEKARGRKTSLDMMVDRMEKTIENPKGQVVFISHGDCLEDAEYVKKEILKRMPVEKVLINFNGPVIGSHSGVGTLAIFYMGNDRFVEY